MDERRGMIEEGRGTKGRGKMDEKSVREVEKIRRLEGFSSSKPLNLFGFFA